MKQHADLKKIKIYKSIGWIEIMFGKQLSDMAEPGLYEVQKLNP